MAVWNSSNISEVHAASTCRVKVCTVAEFLHIHRFLFWKITGRGDCIGGPSGPMGNVEQARCVRKAPALLRTIE